MAVCFLKLSEFISSPTLFQTFSIYVFQMYPLLNFYSTYRIFFSVWSSSLERCLLDIFRDFIEVWLAPAHSFLSISGPLHAFNNQGRKTLQVSASILKLAFCAFRELLLVILGLSCLQILQIVPHCFILLSPAQSLHWEYYGMSFSCLFWIYFLVLYEDLEIEETMFSLPPSFHNVFQCSSFNLSRTTHKIDGHNSFRHWLTERKA